MLAKGGSEVIPLSSDISDWRITFVDTGLDTAIGERLRRVRPYLDEDEVFLANYGDVLTDAPLDRIVTEFMGTDAVGSLLAVKPQDSFHVVDIGEDSRITGFTPVVDMQMRINGGYFVLRDEIFDYLNEGEDLVMHAGVRASRDGRFLAVPYDGFWAPMDTLKERAALEERYHSGDSPWMLWRDRAHRMSGAQRPIDVPRPVHLRPTLPRRSPAHRVTSPVQGGRITLAGADDGNVRTQSLKVGDVVRVKSRDEILATLDERASVRGMPFMPEMLAFAGQEMTVDAVVNRTCDTINDTGTTRGMSGTVHLGGSRCDGSAHGGCQARCLLYWRDEWLTTDLGQQETAAVEMVPEVLEAATRADGPGDDVPTYRCQATEVLEASCFASPYQPQYWIDDVRSKNARLTDALVDVSVVGFNKVQSKLPEKLKIHQGRSWPWYDPNRREGAVRAS